MLSLAGPETQKIHEYCVGLIDRKTSRSAILEGLFTGHQDQSGYGIFQNKNKPPRQWGALSERGTQHETNQNIKIKKY